MSQSESSESSEIGVIGNTNNNPCDKKISKNQIRRWCLTLNNYTEEEYEELKEWCESKSQVYCIGKEVGDSGTPHLQVYLNLKGRGERFSAIKKLNERLHIEACKGSEKQNLDYCSKEGKYVCNVRIAKKLVKMSKSMLRPEQLEICELFEEDEDPLFGRKIKWFYEKEGGWGKSVMCKYMVDCLGAMVVSGANKDILCGIQQWIEKNGEAPRLVVFDIPRVSEGHVSYQAIENIKNGCFFSGKYESGMVRFNSPHILCLSNERPEVEKLSNDRWEVKYLRLGDCRICKGNRNSFADPEWICSYCEYEEKFMKSTNK